MSKDRIDSTTTPKTGGPNGGAAPLVFGGTSLPHAVDFLVGGRAVLNFGQQTLETPDDAKRVVTMLCSMARYGNGDGAYVDIDGLKKLHAVVANTPAFLAAMREGISEVCAIFITRGTANPNIGLNYDYGFLTTLAQYVDENPDFAGAIGAGSKLAADRFLASENPSGLVTHLQRINTAKARDWRGYMWDGMRSLSLNDITPEQIATAVQQVWKSQYILNNLQDFVGFMDVVANDGRLAASISADDVARAAKASIVLKHIHRSPYYGDFYASFFGVQHLAQKQEHWKAGITDDLLNDALKIFVEQGFTIGQPPPQKFEGPWPNMWGNKAVSDNAAAQEAPAQGAPAHETSAKRPDKIVKKLKGWLQRHKP